MSNPFEFENEHAQKLSDLWYSLSSIASTVQKDAVGKAYLKHIIGVSEEEIQKFLEGDNKIYAKVGDAQSGLVCKKEDIGSFWKEIQTLFPNLHRDQDTEFLTKSCGALGVLHFLFQMSQPETTENSEVLKSISTNAHVYK